MRQVEGNRPTWGMAIWHSNRSVQGMEVQFSTLDKSGNSPANYWHSKTQLWHARLAQQSRRHLGCPHSTLKSPVCVPALLLPIQVSTNMHPGRQQIMAQGLGPGHPYAHPDGVLGSWLAQLCCCEHLGEWISGKALCPFQKKIKIKISF